MQVRLWLEVKLFPPRSKAGSWEDLEASSSCGPSGSREMDGFRVGRRQQGGAQPVQEEDEAQQEVKSQHLSLSQLLQVRGSFPRLSAGVRHWGEGSESLGAGVPGQGAQPHSGTATPVPSGTTGTVTMTGTLNP